MTRLTKEQIENLDAISRKPGAQAILLDSIPELLTMAREALLLREFVESMAYEDVSKAGESSFWSRVRKSTCIWMMINDIRFARVVLARARKLWEIEQE